MSLTNDKWLSELSESERATWLCDLRGRVFEDCLFRVNKEQCNSEKNCEECILKWMRRTR